MTFYLLNVDPEAAHRYKVPGKYDTRAPHAQARLSWTELPDFEPVFSDLLIGEDYTDEFFLTDFLNEGGAVSGQGFLLSEKVRQVLDTVALGPHRYYALRSFRINEDTPPTPLPEAHYYYLQLVAVPYYHWIDFEKSVFYMSNDITLENRPLTLQNAAALTAAVAQRGKAEVVCFSKLVLTAAYQAAPLDLFFLYQLEYAGLYQGVIMSSRLQQALQRAGITGMAFPNQLPIMLPHDLLPT